MRLYKRTDSGIPEELEIKWGDHFPGCEKCRLLALNKPATFAQSCAQGAPLIMEHLAKVAAPEAAAKRKAVEEWAKERKTFVIDRPRKVTTKYK